MPRVTSGWGTACRYPACSCPRHAARGRKGRIGPTTRRPTAPGPDRDPYSAGKTGGPLDGTCPLPHLRNANRQFPGENGPTKYNISRGKMAPREGYRSFAALLSRLRRLGRVGFTDRKEPPASRGHCPPGPPRRHFRLTADGRAASPFAWANPLLALYGDRWRGEENAREHLRELCRNHRYTRARR